MLELFDLLFIAFVIIIIQNDLSQENTAPLPDCLKCLCSTPSTCGWQEGRNEHIPCLRLAFLGDVCKINGLVALLPHLPHLWSIKETGFQTTIPPIRWSFEVLDLSSPSASSPVKVSSLPQSLSLRFIGLSCDVQSKLALGNRRMTQPSKRPGESTFQGEGSHHVQCYPETKVEMLWEAVVGRLSSKIQQRLAGTVAVLVILWLSTGVSERGGSWNNKFRCLFQERE